MTAAPSARRPRAALVLVGLALALVACGPGLGPPARRPLAPFQFRHDIQLFETTSGLRFALVPDARTNLATIDVRYAVGAAADPPGLAGLAHLVEHVTFELRPSPAAPTIGAQLHELALHSNASTTWDETHYTATVPVGHLERALRLEALRMRALCDHVDDALLARERDVVLAEERQRSSRDRDLLYRLHELVYGADHPYARPIASPEVARATRADVCQFMQAHYAPRNAYLVVTGPFDVDEARSIVGRTFGPLPPREVAPATELPAPAFTGDEVRVSLPVTHPTAMVLFPLPPWGAQGGLPRLMAARLLEDELEDLAAGSRWVKGGGTVVLGGPRAPVLGAYVEVADPARLDSAADEVFRAIGRLQSLDNFDASPLVSGVLLDRMTRWDDLLGRGGWIADFLQYADHRLFMLEDLRSGAQGWERYRREVVDELRPERARIVLIERSASAARRVVDATRPTGTHDVVLWRAEVDVDEAGRPLTVDMPPPAIAVRSYRLASGLQVVLARDPKSPLVDVRMVFPAGTAQQPADEPLLAIAAAYLLGPPARDTPVTRIVRSPLADAWTSDLDVDETTTTFAVRGVSQASRDFLSWLEARVRHGVYDDALVGAIKRHARRVDDLATGDEDVVAQDERFRERLFGEGHPYASAVKAFAPLLDRLDAGVLTRWKRAHYRPQGATLVVSGAFDEAVMEAEIERRFGGWQADAPASATLVPPAEPVARASWLAVEDRAASQVTVRVGFPAGALTSGATAARRVLAEMVADEVRDVREGLGATYGVEAEYLGGVAGAALVVGGSIDEDKLGAALPRLLASIHRLRDDDEVRRRAFVRARRRLLARLQARVAGASSMAAELAAAAGTGEPAARLERLVAEVAALTVDDVTPLAAAELDASRRVVELRGRRAPVAAAFGALGVTPEWLYGDERDDPDRVVTAGTGRAQPPRPEGPPPAPAEEDADARRDRRAGELAVGDPENRRGPRQRGLYRGGQPITLDEFLRTSGHADAADRIIARRRLRLGLMTGGLVAFAGGLAYLGATLETCDSPRVSELEACRDRNSSRKQTALAVVAGGGTVGLIGLSLPTLRPGDDDLRSYADEHNYRLRTRPAATATVSPAVGPGSVGVVIDGRF